MSRIDEKIEKYMENSSSDKKVDEKMEKNVEKVLTNAKYKAQEGELDLTKTDWKKINSDMKYTSNQFERLKDSMEERDVEKFVNNARLMSEAIDFALRNLSNILEKKLKKKK